MVARFDTGDTAVRPLITALARVIGLRAGLGQRIDTDPAGQRPVAAYLAFRKAMERSIGSTHLVADLAHECGYSVRTITRACLAATGSTAKQLLDERLTLEAQRLLVCTDLGMGEIATRLGYSEQTNFSKAVRRSTGLTPLQIRQQERLAHPPN